MLTVHCLETARYALKDFSNMIQETYRILETGGLLIQGPLFIAKAVASTKQRLPLLLPQLSGVALAATTVLMIFLTGVIERAVDKLFDSYGLRRSKDRVLTSWIITVISAAALVSFMIPGSTKVLQLAVLITITCLEWLLGSYCLARAMENIFLGSDNQTLRYIPTTSLLLLI